ncbi:ferredoxin [Conexibacter sp. JD483]|uniref:ferredoxin n=1 Tax=unclassified Conexibacter TaxID=2627773 RepID=UPI0027207017|nr:MULTISPECIES: ferredoxin [unclassified Conexibacter]MDO8188410.1 ferredoxin [Conexibacter sp. CPCC 205706]MDO8198197.1 ferredoxin [Conexibacter sp. CPCC 205762]MDR9370667.1 ferredoxin [Conexibacter sp. JD483]
MSRDGHQAERLEVDPIACAGHGLCAELLPELIELDDWGYPLLANGGEVPPELAALARRAADACPTLALHRLRVAAAAGVGRATP